VVGDKVEVAPIQRPDDPVILTVGFGETLIVSVSSDAHPVVKSVKINFATPAVKPVTTPALFTLATNGAVEAQVPPVAGVKLVVPLIQIESLPEMLAVGFNFTSTVIVLLQPVAVSEYVSTDDPVDTPVTTPALVTVATAGEADVQVPPVAGLT